MSYLRSGLDTSGLNPSGVINSNFILDKVPGAVAAFSCNRVLKTSYIGQSLIRVRRSSDNVEQNIIPIGNILDSSSLNAFAGANNAYADILYNQINTNNANFTQATLANQPLIISSGNINKLNNKPALNFNGTSQYYLGQSGLLPILNNAPGSTTFFVFSTNSLSSQQYACFLSNSLASTTARVFIGIKGDGSSNEIDSGGRTIDNTSGTFLTASASSANKQYITTNVINTPIAAAQLRLNGNIVASSSSWQTAGNYSATNSLVFTLGCDGNITFWLNGNIQELIIFPFVLNANQISLVEADIDRFYGVY